MGLIGALLEFTAAIIILVIFVVGLFTIARHAFKMAVLARREQDHEREGAP